MERVELELDRGVSFQAACGLRDEAVEHIAGVEGEGHRHSSGFYV